MEMDTDINFETICRLCIKPSRPLRDIFKGQLVGMLKDIAPVSIDQADGLPQQICDQCISDISQCYSFRMKIIQIDAYLRGILTVQKINDDNLCVPAVDVKVDTNDENLCNDGVNEKEQIKDDNLCLIDIKLEEIEEPKPAVELENNLLVFKDNEQILTNINSYQCQVCQKVLRTPQGLKRHKITHSTIKPRKCPICPAVFKEAFGCLTKHVKTHNIQAKEIKVLYKCDRCEARFFNENTLTKHMKVHTRWNASNCLVCSKAFLSAKQVQIHMKSHPGERPYTCDACPKSFQYSTSLKTHKMYHKGINQYCQECNRSFSQKQHLDLHNRRFHTFERPFMCTECGKMFVSKAELDRHMLRHAGKQTQRRFPCPQCDKCFRAGVELRNHITVHTGERAFRCDVCDKTFKTAKSVKEHRKLHSGEKKYVCHWCARAFALNTTLTKHLRTHTGERPYFCHVCGMNFAQSGTLKTHMKMHNKVEMVNS